MPEHFIPSGGIGRLARDGQAFHSILEALQKLEGNQTLLIRRGEPAAVLETREDAPRVMVVNAELAGESRRAPAPEMRLDAQGYATALCRRLDVHGPGERASGSFPGFSLRGAQAFRRKPCRTPGGFRRNGRHGRRPSYCRHAESRRISGHRRRQRSDQAPAERPASARSWSTISMKRCAS